MKISSHFWRRRAGGGGRRLNYDGMQAALPSYEGCISLHTMIMQPALCSSVSLALLVAAT